MLFALLALGSQVIGQRPLCPTIPVFDLLVLVALELPTQHLKLLVSILLVENEITLKVHIFYYADQRLTRLCSKLLVSKHQVRKE